MLHLRVGGLEKTRKLSFSLVGFGELQYYFLLQTVCIGENIRPRGFRLSAPLFHESMSLSPTFNMHYIHALKFTPAGQLSVDNGFRQFCTGQQRPGSNQKITTSTL